MPFNKLRRRLAIYSGRTRERSGVLLLDWRRYMKATESPGGDWVGLCNRYERLLPAPDGRGVLCDWPWSSELHAPKLFPGLGRRLMLRAFSDYPIALQDGPAPSSMSEPPQVSFIIGHRGTARLPHLLLTLQSIAAQCDVRFECIVVEQSLTPEVKSALPSWVRYIHTPLPYADMPYCRSWTFNVGAKAARGGLLVLHDNDMLIPRAYAAQLLAAAGKGYEVINLKRFVFYLKKQHSLRVFSQGASLNEEPPETIVQNLEGGGSVAIDRDAYFAIGGFDEQFIGWGGEDNEFWERAKTRAVWPYAYLPIVHLWHEAQPGKRAVNGNGLYTADLIERQAAIPPEVRIEELRARLLPS